MTTFVALILCIASTVTPATMHTLADAARSRGYTVSRLNNKETAIAERAWAPDRCAVTVMPSTQDTSGVYFLYYDRTQKMTPARANDLLLAWEARQTP